MLHIAQEVLGQLKERNQTLVTAESCTGGLISASITDIPGSSTVFDRGYVTYSNQAKVDILGVSSQTLENYGAVSPQVAKEMAEGALRTSKADIAISVTGIAGPGGGSAEKPVGTVWFGLAANKQHSLSGPICELCHFKGTRSKIREEATTKALALVLENLT